MGRKTTRRKAFLVSQRAPSRFIPRFTDNYLPQHDPYDDDELYCDPGDCQCVSRRSLCTFVTFAILVAFAFGVLIDAAWLCGKAALTRELCYFVNSLTHFFGVDENADIIVRFKQGSISVVDELSEQDGWIRALYFHDVLESALEVDTGRSAITYNRDVARVVAQNVPHATGPRNASSQAGPSESLDLFPTPDPAPAPQGKERAPRDGALLLTQASSSVVLLGVGGGGILHELLEDCPQCQHLIGVDDDPLVLKIYQDWFRVLYLENENNKGRGQWEEHVRLVQRDAGQFLTTEIAHGRHAQAVVNDVYVNEDEGRMPASFRQLDFVDLVHRLLLPGGVLVINIWSPPLPKKGSYVLKSMVKTMQMVFGKDHTTSVRCQHNDGSGEFNWIISGTKQNTSEAVQRPASHREPARSSARADLAARLYPYANNPLAAARRRNDKRIEAQLSSKLG